jgi:hypothetical protein
MSQPSRAGLKFGYRPYGPRSDSRSIFEFSHTLFRSPWAFSLLDATIAGAEAQFSFGLLRPG